MAITPDMPAVMKVSHAHAGMGKIKLDETAAFRDMATVLALNNNYCTSEVHHDMWKTTSPQSLTHARSRSSMPSTA